MNEKKKGKDKSGVKGKKLKVSKESLRDMNVTKAGHIKGGGNKQTSGCTYNCP